VASNFARLRDRVAPRAVYAVVKADAYGHGAAAVARRLAAEGADRFAVAQADEGVALRRAGIAGEVLVLSYAEAADLPRLRAYGLTPALYDLGQAAALAEAARDAGLPAPLVMLSSGGVATVAEAAAHPAAILVSGPAAGVVGAGLVARRAGFADAIAFDMGGTSTDVCLLPGGRAARVRASGEDNAPLLGTRTSFPLTSRRSSRASAAVAWVNGSAASTSGRSLPSAIHAKICSPCARFFAGSRIANEPQNTPKISQPFKSTRLSGIFGISPLAKPITR